MIRWINLTLAYIITMILYSILPEWIHITIYFIGLLVFGYSIFITLDIIIDCIRK